jgi:hypothetical protein
VFFSFAVARTVAARQHVHALRARGIATTATVINSHYDPGGGDPNGWTTDTIELTTAGDRLVHATVGHHGDDNQEKRTHTIKIVYDPQNLTVVQTASTLLDATPDLDLDMAVAMLTLAALAGTTVLLSALAFHRNAGATLSRHAGANDS